MGLQIVEWTTKSSRFISRTRSLLLSAENATGVDLNSDALPNTAFEKDKPLTIVFVGQYSAGKSSILSMLTGEDEIAIGEGITTEKTQEYTWNNLTIIDTPGIHSSLRPDHDEITYSAIANADMLIYVVTNELFDSVLASHFRKLAIDRGKSGEMLLVVNKICRGGTDPSYCETLREGLRPVLDPITPEDLNVSFVDAKSWHDAQSDDDPEIRSALLARCGLEDLIANINKFVNEHSLQARLTTPLYVTEEVLSKAVEKLQPSTGDADIDALAEHLRQQRHILDRCRRSIERDSEQIYFQNADKIRSKGQYIAAQIEEGCDPDAINGELESAERDIDRMADDCQRSVDEMIDSQLRNAEVEMNSLLQSDFSVKLEKNLAIRKDTLPPFITKMLQQSGTKLQTASSAVVRSASTSGATTVAKSLKEFSGSQLHNAVKNVGHFFGHKFAPYEALKVTQKIAKVANVLSVVGVALDLGMNAKEDIDRDKAAKELRKCRQDTRLGFNNLAADFERSGKKSIRQYLSDPNDGLDRAIKEIDEKLRDIRIMRTNKSSSCIEIESLLEDCHNLINSIQSEAID